MGFKNARGMHSRVEKPGKSKSRTIADPTTQKKCNDKKHSGSARNRLERLVQRRGEEGPREAFAVQYSVQEKEITTGPAGDSTSGDGASFAYPMRDSRADYSRPEPAQSHAHDDFGATGNHSSPIEGTGLSNRYWHSEGRRQDGLGLSVQMKSDSGEGSGSRGEVDGMGGRAGPGSSSPVHTTAISRPGQVVQLVTTHLGGDSDEDFDSTVEKQAYDYIDTLMDYEDFGLTADDVDHEFLRDVVARHANGEYPEYGTIIGQKLQKLRGLSVPLKLGKSLTPAASGDQSESGQSAHEKKERKASESDRAAERAAQDTEGWFPLEATTPGQELEFLDEVLVKARSIIPRAFNRSVDVGKGGKDYMNTAYACKDRLVHEYAADLGARGVEVQRNYIHPAALERIYRLIRSTAPNSEAALADMAGVCKDFASLCYGLILQNDVYDTYRPKLAFMHGHVYVEVLVDAKAYAVDAWFGGEVIPKAEHEKKVTEAYKGIDGAKVDDLVTGKDRQASLEASYENAELARLVWHENEARYEAIAREEWARGETEHPIRGSL